MDWIREIQQKSTEENGLIKFTPHIKCHPYDKEKKPWKRSAWSITSSDGNSIWPEYICSKSKMIYSDFDFLRTCVIEFLQQSFPNITWSFDNNIEETSIHGIHRDKDGQENNLFIFISDKGYFSTSDKNNLQSYTKSRNEKIEDFYPRGMIGKVGTHLSELLKIKISNDVTEAFKTTRRTAGGDASNDQSAMQT